jgi:flavin reductase (DIM6/NTAB) family NADH-FMN oxidoreductase RutF
VFPGSGAPNCSKIFANRFLHNIVKKFEYLIGTSSLVAGPCVPWCCLWVHGLIAYCHLCADLHTASFGRVNSFYVRADMNDPMTRRMAFLQHPQIIVQCVT